MKTLKKPKDLVWAIAIIDYKQVDNVEALLQKFTDFEVYAEIPTVRVLKKVFKGKEQIAHVPLLFNYGFVGIPKYVACNRELLNNLKAKVPFIINWLFLSKVDMKLKYRRIREEIKEINEEGREEYGKAWEKVYPDYSEVMHVYCVHKSEILRLAELSYEYSIFEKREIEKLKKGEMVVLRGYPFDGISAELLKVNRAKKEATVLMAIFGKGQVKEVTVKFENLYYSIYGDFEDPILRDDTIEGMLLRTIKKASALHLQNG